MKKIKNQNLFFLIVKLNDNYPDDAPLMTFYSIYHVNLNRQPFKQIIDYKPYETINLLKEDLYRLVERFNQSSRKEGKISI